MPLKINHLWPFEWIFHRAHGSTQSHAWGVCTRWRKCPFQIEELWNNEMTMISRKWSERRFPLGNIPATSDQCNYLGFAKEKTSSLMFIVHFRKLMILALVFPHFIWSFSTSKIPWLGQLSLSTNRVLHRHVFTSANWQTERKLVMIIPSLLTNSNKINPISSFE